MIWNIFVFLFILYGSLSQWSLPEFHRLNGPAYMFCLDHMVFFFFFFNSLIMKLPFENWEMSHTSVDFQSRFKMYHVWETVAPCCSCISHFASNGGWNLGEDWTLRGQFRLHPTRTVFSHSLEPVTSTLGKQKVVYDICFLSKMRESTFLNAKEKYLLDLQSVTAAK